MPLVLQTSSNPVASSSQPSTSTATVKRKLDAVEPTAASLLSDAQRAIVANSFAFGKPAASGPASTPSLQAATAPPPRKKGKGNAALAAKLGIKLKGKP